MDSDTVWQHIDDERAWLADLLESLAQEAWQQPSLCEGWTVRDVAAHLTFAQHECATCCGPRSEPASATTRSSGTPPCAAP